MANTVQRTRFDSFSAEVNRDQYADGRAAKVWELFIGRSRSEHCKNFLLNLLREKGCRRILDVACGTGIDSAMLVEEGFEVVSVDASDKQLKYALKERWNRRREPDFDNWIIEEADWLTLLEDIEPLIGEGFDAVLCLGNSFAHILDPRGNQHEQKRAMCNFEKCMKPGGILLIDHRNYDNILETGGVPAQDGYFDYNRMTIKTSVLYEGDQPKQIALEYFIPELGETSEFRVFCYPHKLQAINNLLEECFNHKLKHRIYGDFKLLTETAKPAFYLHVVEKL